MSGRQRLGALIGRIRKEIGESQRDFAAKCLKKDGTEIDFSGISKLERAEGGVSIDTITSLASHPAVKAEGYTALHLLAIYADLDVSSVEELKSLSVEGIQEFFVDLTDDQKFEIARYLVSLMKIETNKKLVSEILENISPKLE